MQNEDGPRLGLVAEPTLAELAERIAAAHAAVAEAQQSAIKRAIEAGLLLIAAKPRVPHGQWSAWLKANCSFSQRTAENYMRAARHRAEIEAKLAARCDPP